MTSQLFEINCLIPKEILRIDNVNPLSLVHQLLRDHLIGSEVAAIAGEKPE